MYHQYESEVVYGLLMMAAYGGTEERKKILEGGDVEDLLRGRDQWISNPT
jgi:hypothetical protein